MYKLTIATRKLCKVVYSLADRLESAYEKLRTKTLNKLEEAANLVEETTVQKLKDVDNYGCQALHTAEKRYSDTRTAIYAFAIAEGQRIRDNKEKALTDIKQKEANLG
jgi:hypothetical protein